MFETSNFSLFKAIYLTEPKSYFNSIFKMAVVLGGLVMNKHSTEISDQTDLWRNNTTRFQEADPKAKIGIS